MKDDLQIKISQYFSLLHKWNYSYETYAKSAGLSYTSLSIMSEIYEKGTCTQKELAESCLLPKQTVNAVITSFLKKGWVRLEELPEDRRTKTVMFTEAGKEKAAAIMSRVIKSEHEAMSRLTEQQRESLLALTKLFIESCIDSIKND